MARTRMALPMLAALMLGCGVSGEGKANKTAGPGLQINPTRVLALDVARYGKNLVAVGERGLIWTSESEGQSWSARRTSSNRTLTAVAFADASTGVAVGHGAALFRTADGGQTWLPTSLGDIGGDSLLGVTHLGKDRFIAYGVFGLYLESTDGGKTWTRRPIELAAEQPKAAKGGVSDEAADQAREEGGPFDRHIMKVLALDAKLLLVGESGTLAESTDDGKSWRRIASPYNGSYFGALASKSGSVVLYGMRGNVFRSTDGGAHWARIPLNTVSAVNGGTVLQDGRIVLVGNNGLLAISADDGASFRTQVSNGGSDLAQIVESASGTLLGVGAAGIKRIELPTAQS